MGLKDVFGAITPPERFETGFYFNQNAGSLVVGTFDFRFKFYPSDSGYALVGEGNFQDVYDFISSLQRFKDVQTRSERALKRLKDLAQAGVFIPVEVGECPDKHLIETLDRIVRKFENRVDF